MAYIKRSPIWPDSRIKPPFGAAEIRWGHPLSQALQFVLICNEGAGRGRDIVSCRDLSTESGSKPLDWAPSPLSPALSGDGTQGNMLPNAPVYAGADGISVVAQVASTLVDASHHEVVRREGGTSWFLLQNSSGGWAFSVTNSISEYNNTTRSVVVNEVVTLVGTNNTTNTRLYTNGVLGENVSPFAPAEALNGTLGIGVLPTSAAQYFRGFINFVYIYGRPLQAEEALWVHAEPYAMLQPVIRRRWFIPASTTRRVPLRALQGVGV